MQMSVGDVQSPSEPHAGPHVVGPAQTWFPAHVSEDETPQLVVVPSHW